MKQRLALLLILFLFCSFAFARADTTSSRIASGTSETAGGAGTYLSKQQYEWAKLVLDSMDSDTTPDSGEGVKFFGAVGDGSADDRTAIDSTISASDNSTVLFPTGTYRISSDLTFSEGVVLEFDPGAKLSIDSGVTVTINGFIEDTKFQIFSGAGTVAGTPGVDFVRPEWWGAVGDGSTDCTVAIQAAIDLAGFINGIVAFLDGDYKVTSRLTVEGHSVSLVGASRVYSVIDSYVVGDAALYMDNGDFLIRNMKITAKGSAITDAGSKGIQIDATQGKIEDAEVYNFQAGTGLWLNPRSWSLGFYGVRIMRCDTGVVINDACNDLSFVDCALDRPGSVGVLYQDGTSDQISFTNCIFSASGGVGFQTTAHIQSLSFSGCYFEAGDYAIELVRREGFSVTGSTIVGCFFQMNDTFKHAIEINKAQDVVIIGCKFERLAPGGTPLLIHDDVRGTYVFGSAGRGVEGNPIASGKGAYKVQEQTRENGGLNSVNYFPESQIWNSQRGNPTFEFRNSITTSYVSDKYTWTPSDSGTDEYYCEAGVSGDPRIVAQPSLVLMDDLYAAEGIVGSMVPGEWAYGDNDGLGYDTIYVRLGDGTDPDTQDSAYVSGIANTDLTSFTALLDAIDFADKIQANLLRARDNSGLQLTDNEENPGVFVEDGGHVGIGHSAPAAPLHVKGKSVSGHGVLEVESTSGAAEVFIRAGSGNADLNVLKTTRTDVSRISLGWLGNTNDGSIEYNGSGDMTFRTNDSARLTIANNGNVSTTHGLSAGGKITSDRAISGNVQVLTFANQISCDMNNGNVFNLTTAGRCTIDARNGTAGQESTFVITDNAIGGHVVTFGANFAAKGDLVGTANRTATVDFVYDGSTWWEVGRTTGL